MSTGNNSNKLIIDSNHVQCICQNLTLESKTNFFGFDVKVTQWFGYHGSV